MGEFGWAELISMSALFISVIAIVIAQKANRRAKGPWLILKKAEFIPESFELKKNVLTPLGNTDVQKINDSRGSISLETFNGTRYLLVNTMSRNADVDKAILVFTGIEFTYRNTGAFINKIIIKDWCTRLAGDKRKIRAKKVNVEVDLLPENPDILFKVAYAYTEGQALSFLVDRLREHKGNEIVDLLKNEEMVSKIVNFDEEIIKLTCVNSERLKYKFRIKIRKRKGIRYEIKRAIFI